MGTISRSGYFLIIKTRTAKLIGIVRATKLPKSASIFNDPLTIIKIPSMAKRIDKKVLKFIFSFKKIYPNKANQIVCVLIINKTFATVL